MGATQMMVVGPTDHDARSDQYDLPKEDRASNRDPVVFAQPSQPTLVIPRRLLVKLWAHVNEAKRMLTRRGLEVGGLLVGPRVQGGKVTVDEIIPLPIGYEFGPAFQMSQSDLARIAPELESLKGDPSRAAVGFFRSRTRGDGTLRDTDHTIFDEIKGRHASFAADFRCSLVLAPVSESEALVCVAWRYGGGWHEMRPQRLRSDPASGITVLAATTHQQMPPPLPAMAPAPPPFFSGATLQDGYRVADTPAVDNHVVNNHVVNNRFVDQYPVENRVAPREASVLRSRLAMVLYALVAVAGAASGYHFSAMKHSDPTPAVAVKTPARPMPLGFSATRQDSVWKLSWDRASMDALNPVGAMLSIEDGGYLQQLPLAPADLASGALFYTAQTSDLTFSLRLDLGGSHVEEHVRVLEAVANPPRATSKKFTGGHAPGSTIRNR
jgi:hypothetical protein